MPSIDVVQGLHKPVVRNIIRLDNHLKMDGTETVEELRMALRYLLAGHQCRQVPRDIDINTLLYRATATLRVRSRSVGNAPETTATIRKRALAYRRATDVVKDL